MVGEGNKG